MGHRAVLLDQQIFIFGGVCPNGDYNTSIVKVDCETMNLDVIRSKNQLKLQGFSLFTVDEKVYFWGGSGPNQRDGKFSICQNRLLCFIG
jgi:hypothetical protein